ncbi:MAG: EAL domain-containing protein [Pseudomonadota bacterium]
MTQPHPLHLDLDRIEAAISARENIHYGRFGSLLLTSAFQPIFSLAHRKRIGSEGLLRAFSRSGEPVSPVDMFAAISDERQGIYLDRLCRTLHLRNALPLMADEWLFLNINPDTAVRGKHYGAFFGELLARYQCPGCRIVAEIVEAAFQQEAMLADAVQYYRALGCLVAIDDFGAGHSNFDRIWHLQPDIVKLDRSMIVEAARSPKVRRLMPRIVSLLHEAGSLVLMEGVETEREALIAVEADVDFVQGYFFGRPEWGGRPVSQPDFDALCGRFMQASETQSLQRRDYIAAFLQPFEQAVRDYAASGDARHACGALLDMANVQRCYVIDQQGNQLGQNLNRRVRASDPRFGPISDAAGANWFRRPYLRRALEAPGTIQITRPYLSIADSSMCVTLSMSVRREGRLEVLCCDLDWIEEDLNAA